MGVQHGIGDTPNNARPHFSPQDLWLFAHGVDDRAVEAFRSRRSIGAECNYGVRCASNEDADRLLHGLAAEVAARLKAAGVLYKGGGSLGARCQPGSRRQGCCVMCVEGGVTVSVGLHYILKG